MVSENGAYIRGTWSLTNQQQGSLQDRVVDPFPRSLKTMEMDMKQHALEPATDADYLHQRAVEEEIEPLSLSLDSSSNGNSVFPVQRSQVGSNPKDTSDAQYDMMSSVGRENETEALRSQSGNNGALSAEEMHQSQTSLLQHAHSGVPSESLHGTGHTPLSRGGQQNYEPNANNIQKAPTGAGNMASEASRPKLRWQARNPDSADEVAAPGAASSKANSEDDHRLTQDDIDKFSGAVKESSSVDCARNWRTLGSRRRSINERPPDERGVAGQQLVRSPSGDSDKFSDMYDNPASVGDYEPSETSSTTVEEVENNDGSASGRLSNDMGRYSPPPDQGITRSVSRPNLPRSIASSSGRSAFSEESVFYNPQMDMMSPDTHLDNTRRIVDRRHSWDEGLSQMGSVAATAASSSGTPHGPMSVRQKSISQDHARGPVENLPRMSSDPGGVYQGDQSQANRSPLYDSTRQPLPSALRPSAQQPWGTRYGPPQPQRSFQQWFPNSLPEPFPPHPSQSRSYYSSRQIPIQLPPKQGQYPPLPPRGTLPHVLCQHCEIVLEVPPNLPPSKTNTQKLRCGSCKKISIFSVPHSGDSGASEPGTIFSVYDSQPGHSLLASSPDLQADFSPASYRNRAPRPRTNSLSNADLIVSEQVMAERALSSRAEPRTTVSLPTPGSSVQTSPTLTSETTATSNFSEVPRSNTSTQFDHSSDQTSPMSPGGPRVSSERVNLISSDSESDLTHLSPSADGSPQLNKSSSGSAYPNSPPVQDSRPSVRAGSHAPTELVPEAHGLNKALKGIFGLRKLKSGSGGSHSRKNVVVNGVPIPDHLVKKAGEQAGSIHPGQYWYDFQAGFWGVTGGQCLGIIPPFIEEFNYPMSKECAGGRTGILVNGRELHQADREKLRLRGLQDRPGMSYRIEIDGRVTDETTGLTLRSLGRLAPSVEAKGRGTGMAPHFAGGSRS